MQKYAAFINAIKPELEAFAVGLIMTVILALVSAFDTNQNQLFSLHSLIAIVGTAALDYVFSKLRKIDADGVRKLLDALLQATQPEPVAVPVPVPVEAEVGAEKESK